MSSSTPMQRLQRMLAERLPRSVPDDEIRTVVLDIVERLPGIQGRPKALVDYAQFKYGIDLDEAEVRGAMAGW